MPEQVEIAAFAFLRDRADGQRRHDKHDQAELKDQSDGADQIRAAHRDVAGHERHQNHRAGQAEIRAAENPDATAECLRPHFAREHRIHPVRNVPAPANRINQVKWKPEFAFREQLRIVNDRDKSPVRPPRRPVNADHQPGKQQRRKPAGKSCEDFPRRRQTCARTAGRKIKRRHNDRRQRRERAGGAHERRPPCRFGPGLEDDKRDPRQGVEREDEQVGGHQRRVRRRPRRADRQPKQREKHRRQDRQPVNDDGFRDRHRAEEKAGGENRERQHDKQQQARHRGAKLAGDDVGRAELGGEQQFVGILFLLKRDRRRAKGRRIQHHQQQLADGEHQQNGPAGLRRKRVDPFLRPEEPHNGGQAGQIKCRQQKRQPRP